MIACDHVLEALSISPFGILWFRLLIIHQTLVIKRASSDGTKIRNITYTLGPGLATPSLGYIKGTVPV